MLLSEAFGRDLVGDYGIAFFRYGATGIKYCVPDCRREAHRAMSWCWWATLWEQGLLPYWPSYCTMSTPTYTAMLTLLLVVSSGN